jgi:hypothetical protein
MRDSEIKIRISKGDKSIWQNVAANRGLSLTELIMQGMGSFLEGVPTYYDTSVPTKESVPTDVDTKEFVKEKGSAIGKTGKLKEEDPSDFVRKATEEEMDEFNREYKREEELEKLIKSGVVSKGVSKVGLRPIVSKPGLKELPSQDMGSFKSYFKK